MRGTCSWSALLLQISETSTLHWLQSAQVSWLGLCGPETSPWSAGTSLLASIECHADDRQTLFHPFSLVGCQGCCKLSFLPSRLYTRIICRKATVTRNIVFSTRGLYTDFREDVTVAFRHIIRVYRQSHSNSGVSQTGLCSGQLPAGNRHVLMRNKYCAVRYWIQVMCTSNQANGPARVMCTCGRS